MDQGRVTYSTPADLRRWNTTTDALTRECYEVAALYPEVTNQSSMELDDCSGARRNAV